MKGIQTGVAIGALLLGASAWGADTKVGAALDDGATTAKVKAALIGNPDTKARQINVDTSNGVVTLSGTVDNAAAKMSAESTARNISGVSAVENHLMVSATPSSGPATARSDSALPATGTSTYPATSADANGVTGAVGSGVTTPSDRTVIASAAPSSSAGNKPASGNSALDSAPGSSSVGHTDSDHDSVTPGVGVATTSDMSNQIEQALKSDERTANLQVDVKAGKNGLVTLTGSVPNTTDRSAAADVVRNVKGVNKVDNKIMVKKGSTY